MKRRICCFCETWESGGIESFITKMLLHMDLKEMEVDIVAACLKDSVFTAGLKEKGVRFIELSGELHSLRNYRIFRNLLRNRGYDVIHFNLFQGLSLFYVQIAKNEGVPVRIAHSHGSNLRNSKLKQVKLIVHELGKCLWESAATTFWACSRAAANFMFYDADSASIIPNGINTEQFIFNAEKRDLIRAELGLDKRYVVGHIGRLSSEKNQEFLLNAFSHLIKIQPNSRLLLVGSGPDETKLKEQVAQLKLTEHVIFYGTSTHVEHLLWAMDVFAFPSLFEGLGIACVEAQAAGLPVLCSDKIPEEAKVTPLVYTIPLSKGPKGWAEELSACLQEDLPRKDGSSWVKDAGYDAREVANLVLKTYLE